MYFIFFRVTSSNGYSVKLIFGRSLPNVLATMAVVRADNEYSPQSPEPSIPSPISTPPVNVSTIEGWDTNYNTTDDNTFYSSENEPRRVYWDISSTVTFDSNEPRNVSVASSPSSTPPPPWRQKRKLSIGMSFPKKGGVSQHTCEACGQPLPPKKTHQCLVETQTFYYVYWTLTITVSCILTVVHIYGYVYIRIPNNAHKNGYVFIRNQSDPD